MEAQNLHCRAARKSSVMFFRSHVVSGVIACLFSGLLHLAHSSLCSVLDTVHAAILFCLQTPGFLLNCPDRSEGSGRHSHMWRVAPFTVIRHPASVPTADGRGHDLPRPYPGLRDTLGCRECCLCTAPAVSAAASSAAGTLTTGMPIF